MNILNIINSTSGIFNSSGADKKIGSNLQGISVKDTNLNEVSLGDYKGKVLMLVNVASKCMYTKQYNELQSIYEKYNNDGLEILGFPCNDFGSQEPGTNKEIIEFCSLNYGVTFPMFDKVKVTGDDKHPLFDLLTNNEVTGKSNIKWNFEKF